MPMRFIGLMTMFLAWKLQEVTGQPTVALSCGLFSSSRTEPIYLNLVTQSRREEILKKLVTCGEADHRIDFDGFYFAGLQVDMTGLMAATLYHVNDVARLLLHHTRDINIPNSHGWTVLHLAATANNIDLLKIMFDIGEDVNAVTEDYRFTPLHLAAVEGNDALLSLLIARGARVNEVTVSGLTPLMYAAQEGHKSTVALLLKYGADKHSNSVLGTAEDMATENDHYAVANFIRNYRGY